MAMSRSDYELIARAIRVANSAIASHRDMRLGADMVTRAVADVCAAQNARFNRARFLAACGVIDDKQAHVIESLSRDVNATH